MTQLCVFGHHPDLSTDFCIEIDLLEGWIVDIHAGLRSQWPFWTRLSRVLKFVRDSVDDLDDLAKRNALPIVSLLEPRMLARPSR